MKYFLLLLISTLSFVLYGCKEKSTEPIETPQPSPAYFPNSVHSQWVYSVFNKQNATYDTLRISIVGNSTLSTGKKVTLWRYASNSIEDTLYYYVTPDTVEIYESVLFLETRYLLPFSVGKAWKANGTNKIADSVFVTKDSSFNDVGTTKPKGFYLERNWGGLNDYGSATYWFVPGIGMIKEEIREWGFSLSNKSYILISYTIK